MTIIAEWHLFCHLNQWGDCRVMFLLPWHRNTLDAERIDKCCGRVSTYYHHRKKKKIAIQIFPHEAF